MAEPSEMRLLLFFNGRKVRVVQFGELKTEFQDFIYLEFHLVSVGNCQIYVVVHFGKCLLLGSFTLLQWGGKMVVNVKKNLKEWAVMIVIRLHWDTLAVC
jgi:hypothetical protein